MSAAPSHDCTLATASHLRGQLGDAPEHLPTEPRAQAIYAVRQELSSALGLTVPRSEGALHLADRALTLAGAQRALARPFLSLAPSAQELSASALDTYVVLRALVQEGDLQAVQQGVVITYAPGPRCNVCGAKASGPHPDADHGWRCGKGPGDIDHDDDPHGT